MTISPSAFAALCGHASLVAKTMSDEKFARGPISIPPPGHFDPTPPAQDGSGLVSPAGRLRRGRWIYLRGERLAQITALTVENPWTGVAERGVILNYKGREEYRPEWAVIRNFRVSEDGLDHEVDKVDRSSRKLSEIRFKVAMTFPGERRAYVSEVVEALREPLGPDAVFYDSDYQAQLARPNLDTLLQGIYRQNSQLLVVFLCAEYGHKQWCGLEWRVIRDIIKAKEDERVMFVRFDDAPVNGFLSIDGYIDARSHGPAKVAAFIRRRLDELPAD